MLDSSLPSGVDRVQVDEQVGVEDERMMRAYIPHPAHISGEGVHVIDAGCSEGGYRGDAEVSDGELISRAGIVLWRLEIDAADPIPTSLEIANEMVAYKPTGSGY